MKRFAIGITTLLLLLGSGSALADVINVPGDYAQIHDAVQAAQPGDTVLVAAGTYNDCTHETEGPGSTPACVIMQPGVTLSGAGPEATIIDAQGLGRGIYVHDTDDVVIENLQVRNAYAEIYGAGILVRQGSTGAVLRDLRIETNTDGGIIVIQDAEADLERIDFFANAAKLGGGLAVEEASTATVADCNFDLNTAPTGGAMFVRAGCTVTMTGCVVVNNEATSNTYGGGILVDNSHCDISGCEISGNTTGGSGGGLAYVQGATGTVENCEIIGNRTLGDYYYGGGIFCQSSAPVFRGLLVVDNQATGAQSSGGGINIEFTPSPTVENCTLVGNSCNEDTEFPDNNGIGGGLLVQWGATPQITNCIIADSPFGAGIAELFATGFTVTGCDLWNNQGGDAIVGVDGGCNFSADPMFCNAAEGNYRIEADSPCAQGNHPDGGCGATFCGAYPGGCGDAVGDLPAAGVVLGNVPNPFNPQTTIYFVLDAPGDVMVRIHDLRGLTLRTFHRSGATAQTRHEIRWDGRDSDGRSLPSGVYLYQLEVNGLSTSKRMSLIR